MVESSIEYLRGMQVVKAFKQEGVSIAGIRKAYNDSKKINIKIEVEYMPFNCLHLCSLKAASIAIVAVAALLTYKRQYGTSYHAHAGYVLLYDFSEVLRP